jgi:hypothetical protein
MFKIAASSVGHAVITLGRSDRGARRSGEVTKQVTNGLIKHSNEANTSSPPVLSGWDALCNRLPAVELKLSIVGS